MINHLTSRHFIEQFFSTRNLRLLNRSKIKRFHCSFGFGNKENVLNRSLIKGNCPVRRIVAYRSRNFKCSRKFCIYTYFLRRRFGWISFSTARTWSSFSPLSSWSTRLVLNSALKFLLDLDIISTFFHLLVIVYQIH